MIKIFRILILTFSICSYGQDFGLDKLTNSLANSDSKPILIKSEFNNLAMTIKSDKKELISPSYSSSYLYFRDDKIGIILTQSDIHKEPILLSQAKVINNKQKDKTIIFYTKEDHFITVDYDKNEIVWKSDTDKLKLNYKFENLSIASEKELKECIEIFGFDKIQVSDLSKNSQNFIGLSEQDVIYKHSRHYEEPKLVQGPLQGISEKDDLILLFTVIEDKEIQNIVVFDEHKICKYILTFYPNDFLKSVSANYREIYGEPTAGLEWFERVGNKKYSYSIDLIGVKDKFVVHTKQVE